jgi:transglutaminase-like putative cysteine protease
LLALIILIPLVFFLFSVILQKHISNANKGNSALFNQNLFNFDFSDYVELKDEIKMSEDKVLVMELQGFDASTNKKISEGWNRQIYLKRFSLEEYTDRGNFKVADNYQDPTSPPAFISGYMWSMKSIPEYKRRSPILEILYLVNIDSASLMGSDLLTKVVPVTNWSDSPYKQIYKSFCSISGASTLDVLRDGNSQKKFLSSLHPERKKLLLDWGGGKKNEKVKELAESITKKYNNLLYKTLAIQQYLLDEYYYSLKPGLSKSSNQLEYFLFESKKGYCSYFAFAMTLMLRSVGIASRVAVGFAPDMENRTLNFYEIRSIDGHAWVEVFFDDYGWLTFDPTSSNIAPGEYYDFALKNEEERLNLVEQILKNRDKMTDITKELDEKSFALDRIIYNLKRSIGWIGLTAFIMTIVFLTALIAIKKNINSVLYKLTKNYRKKIVYLYKSLAGKLLDIGIAVRSGESILEFGERVSKENGIEFVNITKAYQKALFQEKTPIYEDSVDLDSILTRFKKEYGEIDIKKRIAAIFNISRLWRKIIPMILILFLGENIYSQDINFNIPDMDNVDAYINMAQTALNGNFYDKALAILNAAESKFPDSYKPNYRKGKIYITNELNENALIELLKAKDKGYLTEILYTEISNCYGKIGEDKKAVEILEEAYNYYKTIELYDNLGWMYYKVHDLSKGIKLVEEGLKTYPKSSDLLMTLGTLYSEAWDYPKSKESYLNSIDYSYEDYKSNSFRSIAYYNLALLEHGFLLYDNAFNSTNAAISYINRSSPHLELNYLYLGALELNNAYNEVIKATQLEPRTLFPEMSLVKINALAGKLDEALTLLNDLLNTNDFSWMLYFGTNKAAYYSEIFMDISLIYEYKANMVNFSEKNSIKNRFTRIFRKIYYKVKSLLFNIRYTNVLIKIGEEKIKGGSNLEGLHQIYDAYERIWPAKALKILKLTEDIELKAIPAKKRFFDINRAILNGRRFNIFGKNYNKKLINDALPLIDKRWEKSLLTDALTELVKLSKGDEKEFYLNKLFIAFPTLIPMNNFKIKMNVSFFGDKFSTTQRKKIIDRLKSRGIVHNTGAEIKLNLDVINGNQIVVSVFNKDVLLSNYLTTVDDLYNFDALSLEIFNKIFIYELK